MTNAVLLLAVVGAVGGQGREVRSAPKDSVGPPVALATAIDEQVLSVAFSPDGRRLVTAGGRPNLPGQIQIWHVPTARNLVTIRGIDSVAAMAVSPDGKTIASGDCIGHIKLRDPESGVERSAVESHDGRVTSIAFSVDSAWLASAGSDQLVKLWDMKGLQERKVFHGHADVVASVAFFRHGQAIVSGSRDKTAIIWDVKTGAQKFVLRGHRTGIESVAVSPDDKLVATAGYQTIKLWDAETGKESATLAAKDNLVYALAFSPDNKFLAGAMGDGAIHLWDVKSRDRVKILEGHAKTVWTLAFSRDGALLASGSADKTAKIWKMADGKEATAFATASALTKSILSSGGQDTKAVRLSRRQPQVANAGPEKGNAPKPSEPGTARRAGARLLQPPKRVPVAGLPGQSPPNAALSPDGPVNMADGQLLHLQERLNAQFLGLRDLQGGIVWNTVDTGSEEKKSFAKRGWLAAALLIGMAVTLTAALVVWFFRRLRRPASIPASAAQPLTTASTRERVKPARRRWAIALVLLTGVCALGFLWKVVIHPNPEAKSAPEFSALDIDAGDGFVFIPEPVPAPPASALIVRQSKLLAQAEQELRGLDKEMQALNQWKTARVRFADVVNQIDDASATLDSSAGSKKGPAKRGWLAAALILATVIALLAALAMWLSRRARRFAKTAG